MRKTRRCGACWSWCGLRGAERSGPERGTIAPRTAGRALHVGGGGVGALPQRAAIGDAALVHVVGGDGHGDDVAGQDADEVLADLARDVSDDLVSVVEADAELGVGQGG